MLLGDSDPCLELFSFFVAASVLKLTALGWIRKKLTEKFEFVGRVQAIYHFPVKSCAAIECDQAEAEKLGFNYKGLLDRHWMVVRRGVMLNQKHIPRITLIAITPLDHGDLQLDAPGMPILPIQMNRCKRVITCRMDSINMDVVDCGDDAATWLMTYLQDDDLRLVHSPSHLTKRDATEKFYRWENNTKKGDLTAFSKFTSYMIASTASLHDLNQRLDSPVTMLNFRPNIVIETDQGVAPFDEDTWMEVKIGDNVHFRVSDLCKRCPAITVNPTSGEMGEGCQPLRTLTSYRTIMPHKSAIFGVQCAVDVPGLVKVGDLVQVIRREPKRYSQ